MGLTKIEQLAANHLARAHWSDIRPGVRVTGTKKALLDALEAKSPGAVERAHARYEKDKDEARFKGNVPQWAKRLVRMYATRDTSLTIRRSRTKPWSSGHCSYWDRQLVVTLGVTEEAEQRYTVLHEIAHTKAAAGHGDDFYDVLYAMVRAEGLYRKVIGPNRAHWGSKGIKAAARRARQKGAAA